MRCLTNVGLSIGLAILLVLISIDAVTAQFQLRALGFNISLAFINLICYTCWAMAIGISVFMQTKKCKWITVSLVACACAVFINILYTMLDKDLEHYLLLEFLTVQAVLEQVMIIAVNVSLVTGASCILTTIIRKVENARLSEAKTEVP